MIRSWLFTIMFSFAFPIVVSANTIGTSLAASLLALRAACTRASMISKTSHGRMHDLSFPELWTLHQDYIKAWRTAGKSVLEIAKLFEEEGFPLYLFGRLALLRSSYSTNESVDSVAAFGIRIVQAGVLPYLKDESKRKEFEGRVADLISETGLVASEEVFTELDNFYPVLRSKVRWGEIWLVYSSYRRIAELRRDKVNLEMMSKVIGDFEKGTLAVVKAVRTDKVQLDNVFVQFRGMNWIPKSFVTKRGILTESLRILDDTVKIHTGQAFQSTSDLFQLAMDSEEIQSAKEDVLADLKTRLNLAVKNRNQDELDLILSFNLIDLSKFKTDDGMNIARALAGENKLLESLKEHPFWPTP